MESSQQHSQVCHRLNWLNSCDVSESLKLRHSIACHMSIRVFFTNILWARQDILSKIVYSINHTSYDNFKLKLCKCAQSHALGTSTKLQLEIINKNMNSGIVYFCEIILESSRNICETTPCCCHKWPAAGLFIQYLVQDNNKGNTRALHYWHCVRVIPPSQLCSPQKGPVMWKRFQCHHVSVADGHVECGSFKRKCHFDEILTTDCDENFVNVTTFPFQ